MFKKILIANRGEIAVRIIRACREMGIKTVAVYAEGDEEGLHVQLADESICIGPKASKDSYLNENSILSATILKEAEAIHPGFGFLSENSRFAKMCEECNIKFIGPTSENIRAMGDKSRAKQLMEAAGVPVVPGSKGLVKDEVEAVKIAKEIGYPVMIKASAGGGGKGIRIVHDENSLIREFAAAKKEAMISFKNDDMYMEKFIERPRHIEVQLLADEHGNTVYLGERECSVQRKNQKVLEEAPSAVVDEITRLHIPGGNGIRLDSAVYQNYVIPHSYDSMVGKLIVHAKTRVEAINKMKSALSEFIIEGVETNIDLQLEILSNKKFVSGDFDTSFLASELGY